MCAGTPSALQALQALCEATGDELVCASYARFVPLTVDQVPEEKKMLLRSVPCTPAPLPPRPSAGPLLSSCPVSCSHCPEILP